MYPERLRLDGELTVVMGAGGGRLGTETAFALADAGARLVGIDIDEPALRETADRLAAAGHTFVMQTADVMEAEAVREQLAGIWQAHGPIQHYVHVVGGSRPRDWRPIESYSDEHFDSVLAFNLRPMFQCCRIVAAHMIESGTRGTVVAFSSLSGMVSAPYHGVYGAAKAAISSLTRTMAVEWGPHGIRVNAVAPGQTEVGSLKKRPARAITRDPRWNPLERGISFSEVAGTVLFLTSEMSSGITGQTINIDAGASARSPMGGMDYWDQFRSEGGSG